MQFDFIVVGAGMAGASVAYELAATRKVCLIEAERIPGLHATGRSAALFAPSYGGRLVRALTRASRGFFDAPPPGFVTQPLLQPRGCLYLARDDQRPQLAQMAREIATHGGSMQFISRLEALRHVPLLRPEYVAEAGYDADAMDIDVHSMHQGFLRGARARGVTLLTNASWERIDRHAGLWRVHLPMQEIVAPVVVNAAGAWADPVAALCGLGVLGLQPLRRTAALVDAPTGVDVRQWPAVIDADERFYFKPDATRLLLSPADETPSLAVDAQPEDWDVAVGVDRVQQALQLEVQRVAHKWAGLRTFAPDRAPVVGFDPRTPGFFWCAGQGGYGIQMAPGLSRAAAALAQEQSLPEALAVHGVGAQELSPARLLSAIHSRPAAVE